jgi:hypothetical protein
MADFTVRADSVNVEQVMDQIRARIREKRGVDYTEQQIREMAAVKLEKFLDPKGLRSDLLEQFRSAKPGYTPPELPNYAFEDETLFDSHRGFLRTIRRWLRPILKLFFNPNPLIQALHIQSHLNTVYAEREARREGGRHGMDQLYYEVMHNLVLETTRMAIEVKNLKMRVESLTGRLEFNERRARALESVVVYKPAEGERVPPPAAIEPPLPPPRRSAPVVAVAAPEVEAEEPPPLAVDAAVAPATTEGPGQRSRRRRRRRGRRGAGSAAAAMNGSITEGSGGEAGGDSTDEGFDGDAEGDESGLPAASADLAADRSDAPSTPQSSPAPVDQAPPENTGDKDPHHQ